MIFSWYQHFNQVQCSKTCKIICNCDFFFVCAYFISKLFTSGILLNFDRRTKIDSKFEISIFIWMCTRFKWNDNFFLSRDRNKKCINESYFHWFRVFFIFASTILFEFGTYGKAILLHRSRDHIAQHSQTQSHQFLSFSLCRCFVSIMLCVESLLRASSGLFTFHFLLHDLTSILSWVGVRMLLCICGISAQFIHISSVWIVVCMRTKEYVCVYVYLSVGCSTTRRSVCERYFYLATCLQALQNGCT